MSARDEILAALTDLGIAFGHYTHERISRMEDCVAIGNALNAVYCKNYFLTTKSRRVYAICIVRPAAHFRTSDISRQAGTPRLSFAEEDDPMWTLLRTRPGAVNPLCLMFDTEGRIRLLADEALTRADRLAFHPCDNSETVVLSASDFFGKFLSSVRHEPALVRIHDFEKA